METRYTADAERFARMTTAETRAAFLIDTLFQPGRLELVYIDVDRAVVGSAVPTTAPLELGTFKELASDFFAQRREIGIINIGAQGTITVDGTAYPMAARDCLYIGRGSRAIALASADAAAPAMYYIISYPAHAEYPTTHATFADAAPLRLGSPATANVRTINKYIQPGNVKSCQLAMGYTEMAEGSVWNTMPPHTHERRSEIYLYFGLPEGAGVFHMMGKADETRHVFVRNYEAVISPSWSIHSGVGTAPYSFIWGMGGENQAYDDMDHIKVEDLR